MSRRSQIVKKYCLSFVLSFFLNIRWSLPKKKKNILEIMISFIEGHELFNHELRDICSLHLITLITMEFSPNVLVRFGSFSCWIIQAFLSLRSQTETNVFLEDILVDCKIYGLCQLSQVVKVRKLKEGSLLHLPGLTVGKMLLCEHCVVKLSKSYTFTLSV